MTLRMGDAREPGAADRVDTGFLRRCIRVLEVSSERVERFGESDLMYDLYRAACVKEFEIVLQQSGALLRKRLAAFFASNRRADELVFKDLFRHAAKHRLIDIEAAERWMTYRDCRSETVPSHGNHFGDEVLVLLPTFIADAKDLADTIEAANDE